MSFDDKTLQCTECGQEFVFTAGEQEFYSSRGLMNEPKRCPECRQARKGARYGNSGSQRRQMYSIICAQCGKEAEVPFEPREGRPVYCSDCYSKDRLER